MRITASRLSKKFGSIEALKGIDLRIDEPGVVVILGPNGAGKTTFMKILTGLIKPSGGYAQIDGHDCWADHTAASASLGAIVEQPEFHPYMTGREILTFNARIRGIDPAEAIERVASQTEINGYMDRKTGGYSRGMKQRLALASAMLSDPDILILDEPTFGLDPLGMMLIRNTIKRLSKVSRKLVILSTHLISEASELADRVLIFSSGKVVIDMPSRQGKRTVIETEGDLEGFNFDGASVDGNCIYFESIDSAYLNDLLSSIINSGLKIKSVRSEDTLEEIYSKAQGGVIHG